MSTDQAQAQSPEERILAMLDDGGNIKPKTEVTQELPETRETEKEPVKEPEKEVTEEEAQPEKEAESKDGDSTIEIDPEAPLFDIEVKRPDGSERKKVSLKELELGYMRADDYTRKTQDVARQRDEVPEKIRQGIQENIQKSLQEIQSLQDVLLQVAAPELRGIDFNKLATEDPAEYVRLSNRARQIEQAWQMMENSKRAKQTQLQNEQQAQFQKVREDAQGKIKSKFPNYDEIAPVLRDTAVKSYGFTAEQLDAIHHPGFTELLHDAHEYQKTKSATKTIVDKKVVSVPKVIKPGTPKDPVRERQTDSFKKLQKTGRLEDAQAAIFNMLK